MNGAQAGGEIRTPPSITRVPTELVIRLTSSPEKNGRQLIPLYRAFYEEARQIAQTKSDQEIVAAITAEIQYVERRYAEKTMQAGQKGDRQ